MEIGIKMFRYAMGCRGVDWNYVAQEAVVNTVMNRRFLKEGSESLDYLLSCHRVIGNSAQWGHLGCTVWCVCVCVCVFMYGKKYVLCTILNVWTCLTLLNPSG